MWKKSKTSGREGLGESIAQVKRLANSLDQLQVDDTVLSSTELSGIKKSVKGIQTTLNSTEASFAELKESLRRLDSLLNG